MSPQKYCTSISPPARRTYRASPAGLLPEPIKSYIRQGAKALGCDPAYVALPLLSAVAGAVGNACRLELKRGWWEPAIIWTGVVGDVGTAKSPAYTLALKHVHRMQGIELQNHAEAMQLHETDRLNHERELQVWRRGKGSSELPVKPEEPTARRLICSDATVESLAVLLADNPRGILLARDELSGWVGSFDRYAQGKGGGDAAHWLSMWSGGPMLVDRKTGDHRTIYVPQATVSITGTIQPLVLKRVLGMELLENGMAARLLLAMPPKRVKRWSEVEVSQDLDDCVGRMFNRLYQLSANNSTDGPESPVLATLTPDAKELWIKFCDRHADEMEGLMGHIAAAWSKLEAYCARFALILHYVRWANHDPTLKDPDRVDVDSVVAAEQLVRWFAGQVERVYAMLSESEVDRQIRQFIEMVQGRGGLISVRDYRRTSRRFTSNPKLARQELHDLAVMGYGWLESPAPGTQGGRPSEVFHLASDYLDADTHAQQPPSQVLASSTA